MHGALRNQMDLQAQLNLLNSRESVQIQSVFLLTKTSREKQYQALTEQLISNFRFLGNFELTLVYTLLEQHFAKSCVNEASNRYKQPDTRTRRIVHKSCTISPKSAEHAAQAALRSYQKAVHLAGNPATDNKRQGCEGQHAVLVRSVYVFILLAIVHRHLKRRTAAQAEPVAARPLKAGTAGRRGGAQTVTQPCLTSEAGSRAVTALFTGCEARVTQAWWSDNGGAINPIGVATSAEIIGGALDATAMPPADAQNFAIWQSNGGNLLEYNNFQGAYFGYLMSLMAVDAATLTLAVTTIAMSPLIPVGYTMIATGTALIAQGTALVATVVGAAAGTTMIAQGTALIASGYSQIALATAAITSAGLAQMFAGLGSVFAGFAAASTATYGSVAEVRKKELEYQTAQAELDYLTKAPDLATVKDRLKNYGSQNEDPTDTAYNLYQLTDEDLVYLMDLVGGTPNYAGATPDTEEQSEILDVTGRRNNVQFRDSAGRRYNPHDRTTVPPGPLVNGSYAGYTRVLEQSHDRDVKSYAYYRLIAETAPDQIAYDLGEVTASMLNHGNALREDRKQKYVNAGNAAGATDSTFVFRERDATYSGLFNAATDRTHGGREFAGYRTTFSDYAENQQAVFDRELNQRIQVQQKEWDLREQELNDQYADWEARMNTILTRGRAGWGTNENNFLQEMREWERQMDADQSAAEALWEERVNDHFQAKSDWEANIRSQVTAGNVTEALSEAVDQMNAQIVTMNENMGTALETADRNTVIAQAIQQLENEEPSSTEKLDAINQAISKFNTTLSLSELTGTNLGSGLVSLGNDYREALREQREDVQIYTNIKIFQQYQAMFDSLLEQIEAQNRATKTQAVSDAIAAGFIQSGSQFIKAGAGAESFGVVDAVVGFDGVTAIREEQQRHGSLHGLRGTGAEPASYENRDIIRFLESADSVQVEAFFDHQKLVFGKVAESIMGAGKPEERSTTLQPNEEIHGRLGVWLGRPGDQKITQGLLEAAGDSYYNDQEALQRVAQSATGYGELGSPAVRPSGIGAGFYTQLWFYSQQFEKESSEIINLPLNEGWLSTGWAKWYNSYNLFVGTANSYKNSKLSSKFYGMDQSKVFDSQMMTILPFFKSNPKTGDLETKMAMNEFINLVPYVGALINSGISYDEKGRQRRGGWKWNNEASAAAVVTGVSSFFLSIYSTPVSEYVNQQTFGDEHSNYDTYGTNTTGGGVLGQYAGLLATAVGAKFAKDSELSAANQAGSKGAERAAEAANATATTHSTADIFRGAGFAGRHFRNQFTNSFSFGSVTDQGFQGIGALASGIANTALGGLTNGWFGVANAATGFSQKVGNFFSEDFAGNRWNWETDAEQQQRALQEVTTLAGAGNLEQAQHLTSQLGLSSEQVTQLRDQLDQNYKRDISMTQAAYEAREVAAQFGVAKDGHGNLYNEVLAELRKITGQDGQASPADILEAGRRVAESKNISTNGKQINWGQVTKGRQSAISADLRNRTTLPQVDASGLWMDPLFVNAGTGYSMGGFGNVGVGNFLDEGLRVSEDSKFRALKNAQDQMYRSVAAGFRPGLNPSFRNAQLRSDPNYAMREFLQRPDVLYAGVSALTPQQARAFPELALQSNLLVGAAGVLPIAFKAASLSQALTASVFTAEKTAALGSVLATLSADATIGAAAQASTYYVSKFATEQQADAGELFREAGEGALWGIASSGISAIPLRMTGVREASVRASVFGGSAFGYNVAKDYVATGRITDETLVRASFTGVMAATSMLIKHAGYSAFDRSPGRMLDPDPGLMRYMVGDFVGSASVYPFLLAGSAGIEAYYHE